MFFLIFFYFWLKIIEVQSMSLNCYKLIVNNYVLWFFVQFSKTQITSINAASTVIHWALLSVASIFWTRILPKNIRKKLPIFQKILLGISINVVRWLLPPHKILVKIFLFFWSMTQIRLHPKTADFFSLFFPKTADFFQILERQRKKERKNE